MGDVSQSNRSTIDGSNFVYQSRVVVPRLEFIRGVLQSLSERYDERIIVEFMSPVEEDREFVLKVREKSPWAWSVDEWREFGAGEALPAGKGRVYMLPFNLVPSRDFEVVAAPTPTPALPPGSPSPGAPEPPPPPEVPEIPPTEQPEPVDAPEGASKRVVKAIEDNVANAAETAVLVEAWHDLFQQLIEEFGQAAIDEALQDLGGVEIAFDVADPRIAQHMREFGAVRMEQVNETTQSAIAAQIADGLEASETFRELSARVQAVFQEARESRANLIVNTELTTSTNFASVTGLRQAGFKEKEWLATRDNKVRDTHVELDGTVVGIDENFVSPSGASGPYPGAMGAASEDCNCRCAVITVLANRALSFREAMWKTKDAQRLPWERRLTLAILPAFDKQEKAVIAELKRQLSKSARKRTRQAQPSLWEGREAASAVESL
jgi:SPP1 gp7 family putative phage head morphogenesis protein